MFKQLSFRKWILSGAALAFVLYANKLPVLIDGRTIYAPVTAGVLWNVQDVPLDDIDRIEVIRRWPPSLSQCG